MKSIDFNTMRVNCIQIHQEIHEIFLVLTKNVIVNFDLGLIVKSANELKTHDLTKSWDGMGKYAKSMYDNQLLWNNLPDECDVIQDGVVILRWNKKKSKESLLDCFQQLGGNKLYSL